MDISSLWAVTRISYKNLATMAVNGYPNCALSSKKDTTALMLMGSLSPNEILTSNASVGTSSPNEIPTLNASAGTSATEMPTLPPNTVARSEDIPNPFTFPSLMTTIELNALALAANLYRFPTMNAPEITTSTGSASTGTTNPLSNLFAFDFSSSFQAAGTNQNGTHQYGNTYGDGHNLSFTNLLEMPLDGGGGGVIGGGFTGWDTPQVGQSAYNMGGIWGLSNRFNSPWGNTFNGEINVMNEMQPMDTNDSALAEVPRLNGDMVVMLEVTIAAEVEKVLALSIISGVTVDASVDVMTASSEVPNDEVPNEGDRAITTTPIVQEKHAHKPAVRGEVTLLTTKEAPINLPDWFTLAQTHLEDSLDVKGWKDCMDTWVKLEKALGLSEVGSVCSLVT